MTPKLPPPPQLDQARSRVEQIRALPRWQKRFGGAVLVIGLIGVANNDGEPTQVDTVDPTDEQSEVQGFAPPLADPGNADEGDQQQQSNEPAVAPTAEAKAEPVAEATLVPTTEPTAPPTTAPISTPEPTTPPTAIPTVAPTPLPTAAPTAAPTAIPTVAPTAIPTAAPTVPPTAIPTAAPLPTATAVPIPPATATPIPAPVQNCHPSYTPCVPNVAGDLNCPDIGFAVRVTGPDVYRLDADNDGIGCESYG